jgi:hypothetical protein
LQSTKILPNINELQAITKYVIVMKTIVNSHKDSHYKNSMIFDIISAVHSLTGVSIRNFHYIYRSFIENYLRSMLDLEDNDETGVNQLFRLSMERYGNTEWKHLLDFITSEYSKSCLYVHSNAKAKANVHLYYIDIITNDEFNKKTLSSTINKILSALKIMLELLIVSSPHIVENAFYRNKQRLRYLIGENLYSLLISKSKES